MAYVFNHRVILTNDKKLLKYQHIELNRNLTFIFGVKSSQEALCSANMDEKDKGQEDETKRVGVVDSSYETFSCTHQGYVKCLTMASYFYYGKTFLWNLSWKFTRFQMFQKILNNFQQTRSKIRDGTRYRYW